MKIRTGFVSNSSSSSFCMFGACIEGDYLTSVSNLIGKELTDEDDYYEELDKFLKDSSLSYEVCGDTEQLIIGRSFTDIGDDETGKQFKNNIRAELKRLGIKGKAEIHEGEYYN